MERSFDYEYLADKYLDMVYRIAFSCLKSKSDAEDITQNVMIKLYKSKRSFDSEEHIKFWLIRVTINESNDLCSSFWHKRVVSIENNTIQFQTPEQSNLYYAVMELPVKYRTVVHLYYYEDYTIKEISKILNLSETAVQTQLMRAREKLKDTLSGGWNND